MYIDRATLKGLIDYLGLSQQEAAQLLGINHTTLSRKLAGVAGYEARENEIATLASLAAAVDDMVERGAESIRAIARRQPETPDAISLLIYRHDCDLAPWTGLPFASVHAKAVARVARMAEPHARLVVFDRDKYIAFLGDGIDNPSARADWAARQPAARKFALQIGTDSIGWAVWAADAAQIEKIDGDEEPMC